MQAAELWPKLETKECDIFSFFLQRVMVRK
jgi:hypothetical protein